MNKVAVFTIVFSILVFGLSSYSYSGKSMNDSSLSESVHKLIKTRIDSDKDSWWIRNLASSYPWLPEEYKLIWVLDTKSSKTLLISISPNSKTPTVLELGNNMAPISELLRIRYPSFPNKSIDQLFLVELLKDFLVDPRVYVGSKEFWKEQKPVIDSWLYGSINSASTFKKYCKDPHFRFSRNEWEVSFNVFNMQGGVTSLFVSGNIKPFTIDKVRI